MTDNKKRILIIDDDVTTLTGDLETVFANLCGDKVELAHVYNQNEAMAKLNEWAKAGKAADIVDTDFYIPSRHQHDAGVRVMEDIVVWSESQPENLRPKKLFIHSKTPDQAWAAMHDGHGFKDKVEIYHSSELLDISNFAKNDGHITNYGHTTYLRDHLNQILGTKIPTSDLQISVISDADKKLDDYEAVESVEQGVLTPEQALKRYNIDSLSLSSSADTSPLRGTTQEYGHPEFDKYIGGAITGGVAFTDIDIDTLHASGRKAVLVVDQFVPSDTHLLSKADGIVLLGKGTEHLEIVVANHDIPAALEAGHRTGLTIKGDGDQKHLTFKSHYGDTERDFELKKGDAITISSSGCSFGDNDEKLIRGALYKGELPIENDPLKYDHIAEVYSKLIGWADDARQKHGGVSVKANADTPDQVAKAIELGAEGVGLLRTEHMFFAKERLEALQSALLTDDANARQAAFASLKQFQKDDFVKIFGAASKAEQDFPLTVRLLDAPPEEFLAPGQVSTLTAKVGSQNLRGVQLAQKVPGLYSMQAEAIFEAAKDTGYKGKLEVMIPLIRTVDELKAVKHEIAVVAEKYGMKDRYQLRAMVETVDAVKNAGAIAKEVEGISFGTNDLTAEVLGNIKRDDIEATREWMARNKHVGKSPFLILAKPVKALMQETVEAARKANPGIDIGICGHQVAGELASIEFSQQSGLDSISVPSSADYLIRSRIIAGQAALNYPKAQSSAADAPKKKFAELRKPRRSYTDDAPTGTTLPDGNDRDSRNDQWDRNKN